MTSASPPAGEMGLASLNMAYNMLEKEHDIQQDQSWTNPRVMEIHMPSTVLISLFMQYLWLLKGGSDCTGQSRLT